MPSSQKISHPLVELATNVPLLTDNIYILRNKGWKNRSILGRVRYQCGHRDQKEFSINVYGRERAFPSEYFEPEHREHCGDCSATRIKNEVMRCGLNGCPIFDKEVVTLYSLPSDLGLIPPYARVVLNPSNLSYEGALMIGCINRGCMPTYCQASGTYKNKFYYPLTIGRPPQQIAFWANRLRFPYVFPVPSSHC